MKAQDLGQAWGNPRAKGGCSGAGGPREPANAIKNSDLGLLWSSPVAGRMNS